QVLGADPQACDAARCLRPPGSLHTKRQPPTVARLLEHAPDRVYTLAAIEAALPPEPTQAQRDGTERTNGHVDWAALFVGIPAGERNDRLFRAACRLRGENVPLELARHLALDWAARCQPPLAPAEATRIVEGVYRRYQPTPALPVDGAGAQRARYHGIDRPWPEPPADAVYHGLAGQFVEAVLPHTEADPLALLSQFLVAFGCAVGPQPHAVVGATRHPARLFLGLVGETAKARKGDALQPVRAVFSLLAEDLAPRWANGLASGEGLIWAVRDPIERTEPIKERGRTVGYETVVADAGEPDKRLLVVEPELARVLAVMGRQGNTLSPVLRDAWDSGDLRILTKNAPAKATGAHVAVVGHITRAELERELPDVEMANGFANRFLWLAVRRSKLLPEPEPFAGEAVHALARALAQALGSARRLARIERDAAARALWADIYPELAADRTGLAGALLARAEAQVLRLSLLYALLDGSPLITVAHLHAALELWGYAERSVAFLFGDATGDPIADAIARALAEHGELTRTTISNLFGRHVPAARVDLALQTLLRHGRVRVEQRATDGRPAEVWRTAGEAP
ncbi:MAG: primase C-terminal domain-containing protein, partial [Chloroflexi bacterium]|nr:primase C-terminal domain-containing protein [Chloroflexota bacterium]